MGLACLVASSCAATAVAPRPIVWDRPTPGGLLERTALWIEDIEVHPESDVAPAAVRPLSNAFRDFFTSGGGWARVIDRSWDVDTFREKFPEHRIIRVKPRLLADFTERHTYVLDALTLMTLGYFPLSPSWGEVDVQLEVSVLDDDGKPLFDPVRAHVETSHGTLIYGMFRVDQLEHAFRRAYQRAFTDVSTEVRRRIEGREREVREAVLFADLDRRAVATASVAVGTSTGARALAAVGTSTSARALAAVAPPSLSAPSVVVPSSAVVPVLATTATAAAAVAKLAMALAPPPELDRGVSPSLQGLTLPPAPIYLPPDGFDIITRPFARDDDSLATRYVRALGGVEAAAFRGGATVTSRTTTANAVDELVGSGRADASGYRFSFYRPPDRTGFFFPPSVGLLWEDITIAGFRDDIPLANVDDIPAVASDPNSGLPVDLTDPLSYDLELRSAFIGQGLGVNLVAGVEDVQLFFTLQGHLNLLEIRYVQVQIGRTAVEGYSVVGAHSAGLGGQLGLAFPNAHLAVRGMFTYEWFFDFDFPEPVEFQAATRYNPDKDVFERERAFVKGASVQTYNAQIAVSVLF